MLKVTTKDPLHYDGHLLVYFAQKKGDKKLICNAKEVEKALRQPMKAGDFIGEKGQTFLFYPQQCAKGEGGVFKAKRVLVVGLGEFEGDVASCREEFRLAAGTAVTTARSLQARDALTVLPGFLKFSALGVAECVAEGLILGNYRFSKYKKENGSNENGKPLTKLTIHAGGFTNTQVEKGVALGRASALAGCAARDMANEPGNGWTPQRFADFGKKIAHNSDLKCRVLEKSDMKKLGMGGLISVNQGSALPPKLVILEYISGKKNPTLMFVGKGLTFDSGGISLKPSPGMEEMKYDMCGGAAVISAMQIVAKEKPGDVNVVALIPATDNMSGSAATRPGDIITHYNGVTSEVVNTDAEGRLILADALSYGVEKYSPDIVIDLATLTGAVIFGLGHHRTGLLSNNDELVTRIMDAGDDAGEPLWRLPLGPEYTKQLKSEVADLKNIGGKPAGTITAAAYLEHFIGKTPWAHLDIAGTAWNFTEKSYIPKGPSGIGVRTIANLIRNWYPLKKTSKG